MPKTVLDVSMDSDDQEVRRETAVNAIKVCDISSPADQLITYFSDWRKLKVAVAWILRLKTILLEQSSLKKKGNQIDSRRVDENRVASTTRSGILTLDELSAAENAIIC